LGDEKIKFNENKLDVLRELANIGVGNAVTALSQMLNEEKIGMDVPVVDLALLQDVPEMLGGAEQPVAGVYIESHGDLSLTFLFVLPLDSAARLITTLVPGSIGDFDEMGLSALIEVGNILTGSYLNALSALTNLRLMASPPEIAVDMSGAIITTVVAEANITDDKVVLLRTSLNAFESHIEGHVIILPGSDALSKIFALLGIR
jgi:chemotaxis protein CheC